MSKYTGTQTEKNLEAAFAGESQARNKYTYFASKAKKEGFEQIAALFLKTAESGCCRWRGELRVDRHVRRIRGDRRERGIP